MMPTLQTSPSPRVAPYKNGEAWWHALGDVPLARIVMDPPPGTATEADLLLFVERDKRLVELINGTLVEKPVGWEGSELALALAGFLLCFIKAHKLGRLGGEAGPLKMANGRIRLPDLSFIAVEDLEKFGKHLPAAPRIPFRLAVEILSESNTRQEMQQKLAEYFDSGTRLMWIVDPKTQTVAVFDSVTEAPSKTLTSADTLDGGDVLPGFTLPLNQLFESHV